MTLPIRPKPWLGLDALRAWGAVGVVTLHACVPYSSPSMPGLVWPVIDTSDPWVTTLMWSIEVVIMPIFLVIAGFLAAHSLSRRSPIEFFRGRLRRLGWPLLLCTLILIPTELYIWLLGWLAEGHITPRKLLSLKFPEHLDRDLWGLSHLWFLQYVLSYVAIQGMLVSWLRRSDVHFRSRPTLWLAACGLIAGGTLSYAPQVVWGFQHSFFPVASKWVYSGAFFFAGAFWYVTDPSLKQLRRHGVRLLLPGVCLLAAAVSLGIWRLDPSTTSTNSWIIRSCLAGFSLSAASLITFGLIGVLQAQTVGLGRVLSELASASFLIYLLHHPVVALAHISLKFGVGVGELAPPWLKVMLATAVGIAVPMATHWLVQQRKRSRRQADDAPLPIEPIRDPSAHFNRVAA